MIKINADQINQKLSQDKGFLPYYLLLGSDPYLLHSTQTNIKEKLKQKGFEEQLTFSIDNQTDWDSIYHSCQAMSLFSTQTLILLQFGDNGLNTAIVAKLNELTELLSPDVALILVLNKITKAQENGAWYKTLSDKLCVVSCNSPDAKQLPDWLKTQMQQRGLHIETQAIELLCYCYEGNLLALAQLLEQLHLLYPKGHITYSQIEKLVDDAAIFTPYHWVDAMLAIKSKRAIHILQQLKMNDVEPVILLRTVQRELILLINIQKRAQQASLKIAFDEYRVWQIRRSLITQYLHQSDLMKLYQILARLTELEIALKHDYQTRIWDALSAFSMLFMGLNHD